MRQITDTARLLRDFGAYLTMQRGLSVNTRDAYRFDIEKFLGWLAIRCARSAPTLCASSWPIFTTLA